MPAIDDEREPWCANCGSSDPSAPCTYGASPNGHVMVLALVEIAAALDGIDEWCCAFCGEPCGHKDEAMKCVRRALLGPSGENNE